MQLFPLQMFTRSKRAVALEVADCFSPMSEFENETVCLGC